MIPHCRDRRRLQSSVPRHLVGLADCHQVFPQNILRRTRYGEIRLTTQTPRDDPTDCPSPQSHYLDVESYTTGAPPTHNNMPAAETWETRPCCTLRISAPPAPSPFFKLKPELPTGAMVQTIAIQRRLTRLGKKISRRQDPCGRSPKRVTLSSSE